MSPSATSTESSNAFVHRVLGPLSSHPHYLRWRLVLALAAMGSSGIYLFLQVFPLWFKRFVLLRMHLLETDFFANPEKYAWLGEDGHAELMQIFAAVLMWLFPSSPVPETSFYTKVTIALCVFSISSALALGDRMALVWGKERLGERHASNRRMENLVPLALCLLSLCAVGILGTLDVLGKFPSSQHVLLDLSAAVAVGGLVLFVFSPIVFDPQRRLYLIASTLLFFGIGAYFYLAILLHRLRMQLEGNDRMVFDQLLGLPGSSAPPQLPAFLFSLGVLSIVAWWFWRRPRLSGTRSEATERNLTGRLSVLREKVNLHRSKPHQADQDAPEAPAWVQELTADLSALGGEHQPPELLEAGEVSPLDTKNGAAHPFFGGVVPSLDQSTAFNRITVARAHAAERARELSDTGHARPLCDFILAGDAGSGRSTLCAALAVREVSETAGFVVFMGASKARLRGMRWRIEQGLARLGLRGHTEAVELTGPILRELSRELSGAQGKERSRKPGPFPRVFLTTPEDFVSLVLREAVDSEQAVGGAALLRGCSLLLAEDLPDWGTDLRTAVTWMLAAMRLVASSSGLVPQIVVTCSNSQEELAADLGERLLGSLHFDPSTNLLKLRSPALPLRLWRVGIACQESWQLAGQLLDKALALQLDSVLFRDGMSEEDCRRVKQQHEEATGRGNFAVIGDLDEPIDHLGLSVKAVFSPYSLASRCCIALAGKTSDEIVIFELTDQEAAPATRDLGTMTFLTASGHGDGAGAAIFNAALRINDGLFADDLSSLGAFSCFAQTRQATASVAKEDLRASIGVLFDEGVPALKFDALAFLEHSSEDRTLLDIAFSLRARTVLQGREIARTLLAAPAGETSEVIWTTEQGQVLRHQLLNRLTSLRFMHGGALMTGSKTMERAGDLAVETRHLPFRGDDFHTPLFDAKWTVFPAPPVPAWGGSDFDCSLWEFGPEAAAEMHLALRGFADAIGRRVQAPGLETREVSSISVLVFGSGGLHDRWPFRPGENFSTAPGDQRHGPWSFDPLATSVCREVLGLSFAGLASAGKIFAIRSTALPAAVAVFIFQPLELGPLAARVLRVALATPSVRQEVFRRLHSRTAAIAAGGSLVRYCRSMGVPLADESVQLESPLSALTKNQNGDPSPPGGQTS